MEYSNALVSFAQMSKTRTLYPVTSRLRRLLIGCIRNLTINERVCPPHAIIVVLSDRDCIPDELIYDYVDSVLLCSPGKFNCYLVKHGQVLQG